MKRILFWWGLFLIFTSLILVVDVQNVGVYQTSIGMATLNVWFHRITGVHMFLYEITDWLGLVPIFVCIYLGIQGLKILIHEKRIDKELLMLGVYYVLVIVIYLFFERVVINYRPILIQGHMEASYPSSTTLLVFSVMPTLIERIDQKYSFIIWCFCAFMVGARMFSGVHWLTDIIGAMILSKALLCLEGYLWNCMKRYKN